MRKWEEKYEKLKNGEFDTKIDELKLKVDEKKATREEYQEYQKLSQAKQSISKVENVIAYREKLSLLLEDIKKEEQARKDMQKASEESLKIEEELKGIEEELKTVFDELKDKSLTPEKKVELESKKSELEGKRNDNNKRYLENQAVLKTNLERTEKFKGEDLESLKLDTSSKISKCNMVANSLVNGLSWDSIDLKLENWKNRKFTQKDEKSVDPIEAARRAREQKVKEFKLNPDLDKEFGELDSDLENNNKPDLTFADKHPRLAKIGNFFKGIKDKITRKAKSETENTETKEPAKKEEKTKEEPKKLKDDFKDYIKYVAEYGEQEARKKQLQEKFGRTDKKQPVMTEKGRQSLKEIDETVKRIQEENEGPEL